MDRPDQADSLVLSRKTLRINKAPLNGNVSAFLFFWQAATEDTCVALPLY